MKQGPLYTIVFILLLTAAFTAVLAGADVYFQPRIAENAKTAERRDVLYSLGLDATGDPEAVATRFEAAVRPRTVDGIDLFVQTGEDGQTVAWAVPFTGSGLWGTIRGYVAVSADFDEVVGIVFTAQNETPGLGGRIDEAVYKEQFRGLDLSPSKRFAYGGTDGLDAVTGATVTSNAVLSILNDFVENTLPRLEVTP